MMREKVERFEHELNKMHQAHCPVRHYLAGGIYAREMTIPAGVVLTGAVHRHEHLCTISQGVIAVSTDEGMKLLSAPYTLISKPGAKRVGYALETTVWTTYHIVGDEKDIDKITFEITESTRAELLGGADNVQAMCNRISADQQDYSKFLSEYGLTEDVVKALVNNTSDRVDIPIDLDVGPSQIHGNGMFARRDISQGSFVAKIRIKEKRTPAGWLINHSCRANIVYVQDCEGGLDAIALHDISEGEEITVDYRQAMSVNGSGIVPIERIIE